MGQSTDAVLAYGYDLGSNEDEWKIAETGEYGRLTVAWYDEDSDDSFREQAEKRLLAAAGFTEEWSAGTNFHEREAEAKARVGVKFESYCSGDYPMFVLAAKVITVHRGDSMLLDLGKLAVDPIVHGWDAKLAAAVQTLGITPTQEQPGWVLCSFWG